MTIKTFEQPLKASNHCRHYSYERGISWNDGVPRCAVGVDLSASGAARKCMPDPQSEFCESRVEYSDAERETWEAALEASLDRLRTAMQAVPHPIPMRTSGTMECPNCGGKLHYGRWRGGGEIHCETKFCCGAHFSIRGDTPWPASPKVDG